MHLETLLYMLVQSDEIRPPPGPTPNFQALAAKAVRNRVANRWVSVPACKIAVGLDDADGDTGAERYFGWDNEKPAREVYVPAFHARARPITNQEYAKYLEETCCGKLPASWSLLIDDTVGASIPRKELLASGCNGDHTDSNSQSPTNAFIQGKAVRSVYGPVPLQFALDWPVLASFDELSSCAQWMNGRIPTAEEAQSIVSGLLIDSYFACCLSKWWKYSRDLSEDKLDQVFGCYKNVSADYKSTVVPLCGWTEKGRSRGSAE